jgi:hypothetical protein
MKQGRLPSGSKRRSWKIRVVALVVAICVIVAVPGVIVILLLFPALAGLTERSLIAEEASHLRLLGTAIHMYANDYDGRFPPTDDWENVLLPYAGGGDVYLSPVKAEAGRAYAMNGNLEGLRIDEISNPARTVLFFECPFGSPPAGGPELMLDAPRHADGYVIIFVNGNVEAGIAPSRLDTLIWEP